MFSLIQSFATESEKIRKAREAALTAFKQRGLPNRKWESWKYTPLRGFSAQANWEVSAIGSLLKMEVEGSSRLVKVTSLEAFYQKDLELLDFFDKSSQTQKDSLDDLHQSQVLSGQHLLIERDQSSLSSELKIKLSGQRSPVAASPFKLAHFEDFHIEIQSGAKAQIFLDIGDLGFQFFSFRSRIRLGRNSELCLVINEESGVHSNLIRSQIAVDTGAKLRIISIAQGGNFSRHDLDILINGSEAEVDCIGGCLGMGNQLVDHHTNIVHSVGGSRSRQLYKGVLADQAKFVFNGRVKIEKDAFKASSEQLNKNLLLSSLVEVDTKPQLEIDADDVKATHGATVGRLNPEEIFYLQSRGIDAKLARSLLALGFLQDIALEIPEKQWQDQVVKTLNQKMKSMVGL
jgi:FeS assembly protein SufD